MRAKVYKIDLQITGAGSGTEPALQDRPQPAWAGKGAPAITPAGMMGDRASVIFAVPDDFNKTAAPRC
jgi:hypothetical protein